MSILKEHYKKIGAMGGKKKWSKIPKAERSKMMSELAKLKYKKLSTGDVA